MSEVLSLEKVLDRHRVGMSEAEVAEALDEQLTRRAPMAVPPMGTSDSEFLEGFLSPAATEALRSSAEEVARENAQDVVRQTNELVSGSVGLAEAALRLGLSRSRISQLIGAAKLWCFRLGRTKRIPTWQFTGKGLLPGLDVIVKAIPRGMAPLAVERLMLVSQSEFDDDNAVGFLAAGGDPALVAGLLEAMGRW